jgi:hypothetical protein
MRPARSRKMRSVTSILEVKITAYKWYQCVLSCPSLFKPAYNPPFPLRQGGEVLAWIGHSKGTRFSTGLGIVAIPLSRLLQELQN